MPTLELKMFGAVRPVLVTFTEEQDALDVALKVEELSGVAHGVQRIGETITVDQMPYGVEHV